MIQMKKTS